MEEAGNYRTICTLPALCKLFSTLLYKRRYTRLDRGQPDDHGGFRRSFHTLDLLATYRLIEQRCREWRIKMWIATVEFAKAFDTIKHNALWTALALFGIEPHYICLLKRLYADQKATVLTDKESDTFEIRRGTKRGDPLGSSLFNTVMQAALEDDWARWRETGMGISLGVLQPDCLSKLQFADDVLFSFTSLEQLRSLMCDFKKSTEVGLKIFLEKTKNTQQPRIKERRCFAGERTCEVSRSNDNFRTTGDN